MHKTTKIVRIRDYGKDFRGHATFASNFEIPAGTLVKPCNDGTGQAWVNDLRVIPAYDKFDAEYRGVRIPADCWE